MCVYISMLDTARLGLKFSSVQGSDRLDQAATCKNGLKNLEIFLLAQDSKTLFCLAYLSR